MAASAHALHHRIALLKVELHQHDVLSPLDGVIDEVYAEPGEHVPPGARLALAHDEGAMWLEARITEPDLPRIIAGATVEIHLDAAREACHGTVERIGAAAMAEFELIPNANPAGAINQMAASIWASAQVLAFRDCFLATGLVCLILTRAGLLVPSGIRDRSNFTDRLKAALTLFR